MDRSISVPVSSHQQLIDRKWTRRRIILMELVLSTVHFSFLCYNTHYEQFVEALTVNPPSITLPNSANGGEIAALVNSKLKKKQHPINRKNIFFFFITKNKFQIKLHYCCFETAQSLSGGESLDRSERERTIDNRISLFNNKRINRLVERILK